MSNERSARPSDWITIGMSGMWVLLIFRNRLVALEHTLPSGCMSDVTRDITLPVDPEEAWEALIEPGWIGEEAELDPREGGVGRRRARCAGHRGQPRGLRARPDPGRDARDRARVADRPCLCRNRLTSSQR